MAPISRAAYPHRLAVVALLAIVSLVSAFLAAAPVRGAHSDYSVVESTGTIVPGTTEIGLSGEDDEFVIIALPFPIAFYGQEFTSAAVSTNGNVQFDTTNATDDFEGDDACLPDDNFGPTVFGYFDDLTTFGEGAGVFSAVTGSAPNRQFILEWRAEYFESEAPINFEIIFYENSTTITVIYADTEDKDDDLAWVGVQESFTGRFTEWDCDPFLAALDGLRLDFVLPHGTLQFDPATYAVAEDAGNAFVTVTRTGGSEGEVTVDVAATGGTASALSDYAFIPTTLTFADGETSRTFGVAIVNDVEDEPDETIVLTLSNPTGGATLGAASTATVTIMDNDAAPATPTPSPSATPPPSPSATPSPTPMATPLAAVIPNTADGVGAGGGAASGVAALLAIALLIGLGAAAVERRRRA